jgi:putative nucleotidyltransferase with HDIG domain
MTRPQPLCAMQHPQLGEVGRWLTDVCSLRRCPDGYPGWVTTEAAEARGLAERLLSHSLPRRWSHVSSVAQRAEEVATSLGLRSDLLVSAAWLHDIGYAPPVVVTGFHPLDGARYLRTLGYSERLVSLVAHHSRALLEAEIRGLDRELLDEFPREESVTADALWFCDMTTGPDGVHVPVRERLAEIRTRYGPGDVVTCFIDRAEADLIAAVRRTEERLSGGEHTRSSRCRADPGG